MKKILLIEHDEDVRDIITYILEDEGLTVIAMDAPEELEHIIVRQPDLILIDEWLSDKPGHRLCLRIKQVKHMSMVPVIILSTANNIEQIALECHADDFIKKPFDLDELVSKVKQQLYVTGY